MRHHWRTVSIASHVPAGKRKIQADLHTGGESDHRLWSGCTIAVTVVTQRESRRIAADSGGMVRSEVGDQRWTRSTFGCSDILLVVYFQLPLISTRMYALEALLDRLPLATAQEWHEDGLSFRMEISSKPERFALAHRLFTFSALLGSSAAKYQLGVMNLRGEGRPKDKLRALMWFKLANTREEPRAPGNLAMVAGDLAPDEIRRAHRMAAAFPLAESAFRRARMLQDDDAIVDMAGLLMRGEGVDPDPELAVAWLNRGIVLRHAGAQWLVGLAYASGRGAPANLAEGMRLLQQAADRGHTGAQYDLAELLLKQGGATHHARGLHYLAAAAQRNHLQAMYRLGMLCRAGEAGSGGRASSRRSPHLTTALDWLGRAAERGHAEAQYELGQMHAQGLGTAQDFEQALRCYLLAAAQGHAKAQFNLGFLHAHGQGVEQDYVKAYEWYAISEASGYALAKQSLDHVGKKLAPEELELAQWRADSFRYREQVVA